MPSAYSIWIPRDARRALCLAYGGNMPSALIAGLAEQVDVDPAALNARDAFDVVMLIGHPTSRQDFLRTISSAWASLHSPGTLIVAFEPSAGSAGVMSTLGAWLRPATWINATAIDTAIRSLAPDRVTRLHVFPSVWRPMLLHTPESPAVLKRMALAHVGGWRAGTLGRVLLGGGRTSAMDLCPAGIAWVACR